MIHFYWGEPQLYSKISSLSHTSKRIDREGDYTMEHWQHNEVKKFYGIGGRTWFLGITLYGERFITTLPSDASHDSSVD